MLATSALRHRPCVFYLATYSPLLEEHGDGSQNDTAEHRLRLEERASGDELKLDGRPGGAIGEVREVLGSSALFEERLSLDLEKFELDKFVILRKTTETGKRLACLGLAIMVNKPSGREGLRCMSAIAVRRTGEVLTIIIMPTPSKTAGASCKASGTSHAASF